MQEDRPEDEGRLESDGVDASTEKEIAGHPGEDAEEDGVLVAQLLQHDREEQHEDDVRYLGEGHLARDAGPADLGEVDPHHHEVEVERDANEEHAEDEDREGWLPEEGEGVEAE